MSSKKFKIAYTTESLENTVSSVKNKEFSVKKKTHEKVGISGD